MEPLDPARFKYSVPGHHVNNLLRQLSGHYYSKCACLNDGTKTDLGTLFPTVSCWVRLLKARVDLVNDVDQLQWGLALLLEDLNLGNDAIWVEDIGQLFDRFQVSGQTCDENAFWQ